VGESVRLEVGGDGIATLRLDRPPMNAMAREVQEAMRAAAVDASDRADVRAVVVYGGDTVFAAGGDVREMVRWSAAEAMDAAVRLQAAFTAVARIPKPTVAAIAGYALGGGLELALCCDFRVAAEDARLGQPEINLGLIPGAGATQRLPRLVGPARAKDLVFSGRVVPAEEALALGLVDVVVPSGEVYAAARGLVERYATGPALALRAAKEAIDRALDTDLETGLALETQAFGALFATDDGRAGLRSFVDEGPGRARFTGR
jgi:enoyl-CoA hydratase/carnithine racemase